jgi:hypothetical protein
MKGVWTLLMLAWALTPYPAFPADPRITLDVGRPFPDLLLPALRDGKPTSLADFRGKKVVLHVFASW